MIRTARNPPKGHQGSAEALARAVAALILFVIELLKIGGNPQQDNHEVGVSIFVP